MEHPTPSADRVKLLGRGEAVAKTLLVVGEQRNR